MGPPLPDNLVGVSRGKGEISFGTCMQHSELLNQARAAKGHVCLVS